MPELLADLHVHTNESDSTFSPEEVIKYAAKLQLCAISITDHDSVSAIPKVLQYAKDYNIEIIPGIELSADINGDEVHILGYFIDYKDTWLLEKLKFLQETRVKRAHQIINKLNELGFKIAIDDVLTLSGEGAIGRMHIARALMEKKYVSCIPEAFSRFLSKGRCAYVAKYKISPKEAIDIINKVRGISILAHPQIMNKDSIISLLVKEGLDGIEVYHSDHTADGVKKYLALTGKYKLLITGGSDCHGIGKGKILMGTVKIPYSLVEIMKSKLITKWA
jgi:predicted metal-dependent phosphoesterase TrpH